MSKILTIKLKNLTERNRNLNALFFQMNEKSWDPRNKQFLIKQIKTNGIHLFVY